MAEKDEEKKPNIVSGILNDLAMGFGLKERDQGYYDRTAQTIRNNRGQSAGDRYAARMQSQNYPAYGGPLAFIGSGAGPRDFFDGGGLGRSGDRFVGGPMSMLANALGVRPMGYSDRDRIGQRSGADALAALQAGTIPTNVMAPPTAPETPTSEQPLSSYLSRYDSTNIEMPLTAMSQAAPGELTSPMSNVPLKPAGPAVTGSGKYPQYLYDRGYSDMFLDSLPKEDLDFLYSFNPAGR
jgi:hypothetical protein